MIAIEKRKSGRGVAKCYACYLMRAVPLIKAPLIKNTLIRNLLLPAMQIWLGVEKQGSSKREAYFTFQRKSRSRCQLPMYCILAPNPPFSACSVAKILLSLGTMCRFVCRGCWRDTAGREGSLPGSSVLSAGFCSGRAWLVSAALGPWAGDGLFSTRSCNAQWPSAPRGQKLPRSPHPSWAVL